MKMANLRDVAPPSASDRTLQTSGKIWQLNLDQVEAQTGRILSKVYSDASNVGSSTQPFDSGNVLFSKLRPYLNKVVLPDESGIATTELVPLRPDPEKLERRYLAYYLRSPGFVAWASNEVAGAKMPRVVMQSFWKQQIPLPPLPEQKRIAAILDKADAIRRNRQQALRLTDEFLRSVFLDMFGDPVTNPKGWPIVTIRDLLVSTAYGTSRKASETEGKFACLRMNNITYSGGWDFTSLKYVDLEGRELTNNLVHSGQLLFNWTNSKELVGKTAVYRRKEPMAFAGYLVRGIANADADTEFISAFLNLPYGKSILRGMCKNIIGMANINAEEFKSIRIPKPPVQLQRKFAKIVMSVENQRGNLQSCLTESENLFSSLQQRAFRGEL